MRTTLTLDPDVERLLEEEVHRARKPFKQVVNDAIRRGLAAKPSESSSKPFRQRVFHSKINPEFENANFNHLADELDDEERMKKLRGET